ncbi:MAG: TetR/AcrR family transcriptional regulator [Actinomycetes bacterium]
MAPRPYNMQARADSVAETRARIVEAAKQLHAESGVVITSWEQIAERAGVATATVYRHFPSVAELVTACARSVFDLIEPPSPEDAAAKFARLEAPEDRLEQLVRDSCDCYAKGADWLHAAHRERDFVPELDTALLVMEDTLHVLVGAAFGSALSDEDHEALFVLCDFPFWWSLTNRGLPSGEVTQRIVRLVRTQAARCAG